MAKEEKNKKGAEVAPVSTTTVDNIYEELDSASMGRKELSKAAKEKLKEDHDERTKREMMSRFEKSEYKRDQSLLKLRREREIAKIQKEELVHSDRASRFLMGFVVDETVIQHASGAADTLFEKEEVDAEKKTITIKGADGKKTTYKVGDEVPPIIDYVDFDELQKKVADNTRKKIAEVDKVHDTYTKKLRAKYDEYYNYNWY